MYSEFRFKLWNNSTEDNYKAKSIAMTNRQTIYS